MQHGLKANEWCLNCLMLGRGVMIDKTTYNMGIIIITLVHMFYSCCRGKVLVQFHLGQNDGNIFSYT